MARSGVGDVASTVFGQPTTVMVCGGERSLLKWFVYALAAAGPIPYHWTEVRMEQQALDELDPHSTGALAEDRFHDVPPESFRRDPAVANMAIAAGVRESGTSPALQKLIDFLGLPARTRDLLSSHPPDGGPVVAVLANAHRLAAMFPTNDVGPMLSAIREAGFSMVLTFADAPPAARASFAHVVHVQGTVRDWKAARLALERGRLPGVPSGSTGTSFGAVPWIAEVLQAHLEPALSL